MFWNETAGWGTVYLSPFQQAVNLRFGTLQTGNRIIYSRPAAVGSGFTLTESIKDGTTDALYVNGALVLSQGGKLATIAGCQNTGNVGLGFNNTYFAGDIAEVLVYDRALTAGERQAVEAYLNDKYFATGPVAAQITSQPANAAVIEPNPAGFNVTATGTAPLAYQWRRGGVNIGGATSSSYTLSPTAVASDNGAQFSVVVTNASGAVTSVVATLLVADSAFGNGLALWLQSGAGVVLNGAAVTQWSDQSGNNRHATQGTSGNQPTRVNAVLNGLPVVRFDGVNDFQTFNLPVNNLTGMSIFLVAANTQNQYGAVHPAHHAALFWDETAAWGATYLSPLQGSANFRFGTTQVDNRPLYTRPASVGNNFTLTTAIKNGATDALYVNGIRVVNEAGKLAGLAGSQSTGNLGRGYQDKFFAGDLAEVLVYDRALSVVERRELEAYLDSKYALTTPAAPRFSPRPGPTPRLACCISMKPPPLVTRRPTLA